MDCYTANVTFIYLLIYLFICGFFQDTDRVHTVESEVKG
jgi:hypothetical protein